METGKGSVAGAAAVMERAPEQGLIGKPVPRVDAFEKVTGKARFAADLSAHGMAFARVVRAAYPHARIVRVDASEALSVPGVLAVITARDIPGKNGFGVVVQHQPVLAEDKVRYLGDGVALVVAESLETASQAAKLVGVEYEVLPSVFSPEEAIEPGAPVIHQEYPDNIIVHHPVRKGDVEKGFAEADVVIERTYRTQFVEHAYIEPEAALAVPEPAEGSVTVYGSIQNPYSARRAVAGALAVPLTKVRIVQATMGGSFGGKDEVMSQMCARAAVAAVLLGRPVKMVNTREESVVESYKRHPYVMRYKIGATKDGRITAIEADILADGGAYASMSPFVTWRSAVQATGPYEVENVKTDVRAAFTNNTYTGAMRGFGSPQMIFAQESLMDELAEAIGMSPLELRLKNCYRQGSITATGHRLDEHHVSLGEVIQRAVEESGYVEKFLEYSKPQTGPKRRGIGLSVSFRGCSLGAEGVDATGAIVSVQTDGSVYAYAGLAENGQGLRTIFSQIAANELGVPVAWVTFKEADTSIIPDGGPTVASRSTIMGGNAVKDAARKVRDVIYGVAADIMGVAPSDVDGADGRIFLRDDPSRWIDFRKAAQETFNRGKLMAAYGWYCAPKVTWDEHSGQGKAYFTYVYGCQVAEVEVDIETGKVDVVKVTAAHEVGRAINRCTLEGQIYGGVAMGLGYSVLEDLELSEGVTRNVNFDEYLIPTSMDVPEVTPVIVENPDPFGPYGAKTVGEPTAELLSAAVAGAVYQATGRRIRELPLDMERVLLGRSLRKGRGGRGSEAK